MALSVTGRPLVASAYTGKNLIGLGRKNKYGSELRSMNQIGSSTPGQKPFEYSFMYAPASFTHEGYGVNLNEIQRPYLSPIIDVTGGKARKASFQFVIVSIQKLQSTKITKLATGEVIKTVIKLEESDGFTNSIDDEISYVQAFADNGIPVSFNSVHKQLDSSFWYIDNMTFTHSRSNLAGKTVSAQCDISLTEYLPSSKNFIQLPRFKYGNITVITKKGSSTPPPDPDDTVAALKLIGKIDKVIKT